MVECREAAAAKRANDKRSGRSRSHNTTTAVSNFVQNVSHAYKRPLDTDCNIDSQPHEQEERRHPYAENLSEVKIEIEPELDIPEEDVKPDTSRDNATATNPTDDDNTNTKGFFSVFESSVPEDDDATTLVTSRKEPSAEDKCYRADREFLKRQSHRKMIWFFRKVGLRHPAAVRTHLERVKHPEFEIPNLGCVYPHAGLSIATDDGWDNEEVIDHTKPKRRKVAASGRNNNTSAGSRNNHQTTTNMTYYQLYCASEKLVERVKKLLGPAKANDDDYNKRVLTFIADIVGRLLWQNNRIHTVMFAKSDHYDRDCFLLYSRQAEPTPYMIRSDAYFCRRHESDKFKFIAPQPDLTRANSTRLSNDSAIYVVGCNWTDVWETFQHDYRITNCRPMKSLYQSIRQLDAAVLEHVFSTVNKHVNFDRNNSPYAKVAASTSFDIVSALLREVDVNTNTVVDDSPTYRNYVERFVTVGILNVNCLLQAIGTSRLYDHPFSSSSSSSSLCRLDQMVLHNVLYRREVRELRTNRVYYYRNAHDFICALSLVDDLFENCSGTVDDIGEHGEKNYRLVYFYDLLQAFEYDGCYDSVNELAFGEWTDVTTMIHESSHTIGQQLTDPILRGPLPDDPFYPSANMSPTDVAIDRMLERAIKHSKKLKLLTPSPSKHPTTAKTNRSVGRKRKTHVSDPASGESPGILAADASADPGLASLIDGSPSVNDTVIENALSKRGENRLGDGYRSPNRPVYETDHRVEHDGQEFHLKISYGGVDPSRTRAEMTPVDYGTEPRVQVYKKLVCVYLIDAKDQQQIRVLAGSCLTDKHRPDYVKLNASDRIVRVFAIQADAASDDGSYVVKPYIYFVFRNLPTCVLEETLIDEMQEIIQSYDSFHRFNVFEDSNKTS